MRSASSNCSAADSPSRPTDARSIVKSVSNGHFCDDSVKPLVANRSPVATNKPLPGGDDTPAKAKLTTAELALSIAASSAAANGARSRSNRAAFAGGTATTTASAPSCWRSDTAPTSTAKPDVVRRMARTVVAVCTSNRPASASR